MGAAILEEIADLREIADWIRHHHERPDGKGYPHGLSGDEIPLEARIIAVADAFDAMTGGFESGEKRPYREPMSPSDAMREMDRCAGTQFDSAVVQAFRIAVEEECAP
jgi:HD-GYP domain-containing protein (c-di-GMP phosphodiesterase class II)